MEANVILELEYKISVPFVTGHQTCITKEKLMSR